MELHAAAHVVGEAAAVPELSRPGQDVLPVAGDGGYVLHPQAPILGVIGALLHPVVADDINGEVPQLMEDALGVSGTYQVRVNIQEPAQDEEEESQIDTGETP